MLPTDPGFYRDGGGGLWVIAPRSTKLRKLTSGGMRESDDMSESLSRLAKHYAPFTRVRMVPADD